MSPTVHELVYNLLRDAFFAYSQKSVGIAKVLTYNGTDIPAVSLDDITHHISLQSGKDLSSIKTMLAPSKLDEKTIRHWGYEKIVHTQRVYFIEKLPDLTPEQSLAQELELMVGDFFDHDLGLHGFVLVSDSDVARSVGKKLYGDLTLPIGPNFREKRWLLWESGVLINKKQYCGVFIDVYANGTIKITQKAPQATETNKFEGWDAFLAYLSLLSTHFYPDNDFIINNFSLSRADYAHDEEFIDRIDPKLPTASHIVQKLSEIPKLWYQRYPKGSVIRDELQNRSATKISKESVITSIFSPLAQLQRDFADFDDSLSTAHHKIDEVKSSVEGVGNKIGSFSSSLAGLPDALTDSFDHSLSATSADIIAKTEQIAVLVKKGQKMTSDSLTAITHTIKTVGSDFVDSIAETQATYMRALRTRDQQNAEREQTHDYTIQTLVEQFLKQNKEQEQRAIEREAERDRQTKSIMDMFVQTITALQPKPEPPPSEKKWFRKIRKIFR